MLLKDQLLAPTDPHASSTNTGLKDYTNSYAHLNSHSS